MKTPQASSSKRQPQTSDSTTGITPASRDLLPAPTRTQQQRHENPDTATNSSSPGFAKPVPRARRWRIPERITQKWLMRVVAAPLLGLLVFFGLWELVVQGFGIPRFVMPAPSEIIAELAANADFYTSQGLTTAGEAAAGLLIAIVVALAVAVPMSRSRFTERAIQPVAVFLQLIPMVCYAPALVIWFGPGFTPIVAVAALFATLPLLYNIVAGLRGANKDAIEMMRSAGGSDFEVLRHIQIPSAAPSLFAGLRTAIGLAMVGAVLAEWFALTADGLGVQIYRGMTTSDAMLIWSSAFALAIIGALALMLLTALERVMSRYRPQVGTTY